jgi:hypothetical protein
MVKTKPVVVPAVVVIAPPPEDADKVKVVEKLVAIMKYVTPEVMPVAVPVKVPDTATV